MINLISAGDLDFYRIKRYICDSKDDFVELPVVAEGSTVTIISTGETYKINAEGEWVFDSSISGGEGGVGPQGPAGEKGDQGIPGEKGEAGYSPVKGVDYWTDADKADIISDVINSKPMKPIYNAEENLLFCNGVGIIVEDSGIDNLITYYLDVDSTQTLNVPYGVEIYGGGDGREQALNFPASSIIVNGGQFKSVIGGGLGGCHVGSASVVINGGEFKDGISGGGKNNKPTNDATGNTVGYASVVVNDGNANVIYGGGISGLCQVGNIEMEINGGKSSYLIPAGSNGYCGSSKLVINNGEFVVVQPTGNGSIGSATIVLNNGIVDRMYGGGVAGTKVGKTVLNILGGKINKLGQGSSNDGTAKHISGEYVKGVISNEEIAANLNLKLVYTLEETIKRLIEVEQSVSVTDIQV